MSRPYEPYGDKPLGGPPKSGSAVHFVGFRGDEYVSARRVWGRPDFIHRGWDRRSRREIDPDSDTIVFAQGEHNQPYAERNFDDLVER